MKYEEKIRIVPVWQKAMLTLEEAVEYTGIGTDKLIDIGESESNLLLYDGTKCLFKRKKLDEYIKKANVIKGGSAWEIR